ncbi:hypothetical protein MMC31_007207, partial [Peltigera leucophlebia]|nr:hypothetical protein [Peltigera leucophlebia]
GNNEIQTFFRAHSIPPIISTGINREDNDGYPTNTKHKDASDNEFIERLPDQDQENEDDSDGVQKIDFDQCKRLTRRMTSATSQAMRPRAALRGTA